MRNLISEAIAGSIPDNDFAPLPTRTRLDPPTEDGGITARSDKGTGAHADNWRPAIVQALTKGPLTLDQLVTAMRTLGVTAHKDMLRRRVNEMTASGITIRTTHKRLAGRNQARDDVFSLAPVLK